MAKLEAIHACGFSSDEMKSTRKANLIAGVGLEGDRYALRRGTYSVLRSSAVNAEEQELGRQLTIISADGAEAALSRSGVAVPGGSLGNLRRNLILRNVPEGEILKWIGRAVGIGPKAVIFCHRHCVPCRYNERRNKAPGLMEALWDEAGVNCEVLVSGEITAGDRVTLLSEREMETLGVSIPKIDSGSGHDDESFFVRPSQRSALSVRDGIERQKELYEKLHAVDPSGVERLENAYSGVGLSFFPVSVRNKT